MTKGVLVDIVAEWEHDSERWLPMRLGTGKSGGARLSAEVWVSGRDSPRAGAAIGPTPLSPRAPQVPVPNFGMQPANKLQHPPDAARTACFITFLIRHPPKGHRN
jgi:hypothetical protein